MVNTPEATLRSWETRFPFNGLTIMLAFLFGMVAAPAMYYVVVHTGAFPMHNDKMFGYTASVVVKAFEAGVFVAALAFALASIRLIAKPLRRTKHRVSRWALAVLVPVATFLVSYPPLMIAAYFLLALYTAPLSDLVQETPGP